MNVYDQINANNRKTAAILCAFPAALFVMVFLFSYLAVVTNIPAYVKTSLRYLTSIVTIFDGTLINMQDNLSQLQGVYSDVSNIPYPRQALDSTLAVYPWILLVTLIWIAFSYRSGAAMMMRIARAHRVTLEEYRPLCRLVENTAIMAGLPTPAVYLIKEESLNAFASGRKPEEASIALTEGLVKTLDNAELQAIIAHELAHIGNRDTRLLMITVAGIGCFTFWGELLCGGRSGKKSGRSGISALFLGSFCLVFGYIVAPILHFALSRRREYQADATAVKITRDTNALMRALYKIAQNPMVKVLSSRPLIGSMCIANPIKPGRSLMNFISKLYSTHPPIEERIAILRKMM